MTKPTVHYRGITSAIFGRAMLTPTDHPNHVEGQHVSNTRAVLTSEVLSWDRKTGRIETTHTIYQPAVSQ